MEDDFTESMKRALADLQKTLPPQKKTQAELLADSLCEEYYKRFGIVVPRAMFQWTDIEVANIVKCCLDENLTIEELTGINTHDCPEDEDW